MPKFTLKVDKLLQDQHSIVLRQALETLVGQPRFVVDKHTDTSHPVEDIHQLIILARLPVKRSPRQRIKIAQAVVALEAKIESANLSRDSNSDDRISEMRSLQNAASDQ